MKKRTLAAVMTAVLVLAMTGCGNTGAKTESAAAATTQEAAEEVAEKEEWMNDPTAYLSGITAADYVDLPADYASMTVEVEPVAEVSDEEVEAMIDQQRQAKRELQEVTKRNKVQEGDVVNIDYVGRIDGEEFDGGSAEGGEACDLRGLLRCVEGNGRVCMGSSKREPGSGKEGK